jgi:hypothetical protein
MSTQAQASTVPPHRISQLRLWFGACAAAPALAIQGFACFLIAIQACKDGHVGDWGSLSAAGVRGVLGAVTAFLLAVAIAGGVVSFRNWQIVSEQQRVLEAEGRLREAFMALIGVFVSVSCAIGIIWTGIPSAFLNTCVTAR